MAEKLDPEERRRRRNAATTRWAKAHPDRVREIKRRHYLTNKAEITRRKYAARQEVRVKQKAAKLAWEAANPEVVRIQRTRAYIRKMAVKLNHHLSWNYAITLDQFREIEAMQDGACAICRTTVFNGRHKRLVVDHDHSTGMVRGLLCQRCNSAIGYFNDHASWLRRAAAYVEGFNAETNGESWPARVRRVLDALPETCCQGRGEEGVVADTSDSGVSGENDSGVRVAADTAPVA